MIFMQIAATPVIVSRNEWGARPPVVQRIRHQPNRITLHYTGVAPKPELSLEQKLLNLQAWCQREDKLASGKIKPIWADIPYHYYISLDGRIGECRQAIFIGDTNTEYDPTGHLLVVIEDDQTALITKAQRVALRNLVPWLAREWQIPAERLATHRDFAKTDCPGDEITALLPELARLITKSRSQ